MHPDGDELLYLISGAVTVTLELPDGVRRVELGGGDAIVVPKGVWHKITMRTPGQLFHVTPGPNGDARPLAPVAAEPTSGLHTAATMTEEELANRLSG